MACLWWFLAGGLTVMLTSGVVFGLLIRFSSVDDPYKSPPPNVVDFPEQKP